MDREVLLRVLKEAEEYFLAMNQPYDSDDLFQEALSILAERNILVSEEDLYDVYCDEFQHDLREM